MGEVKKQLYIDWELENLPGIYKRPRCNEFIDRQTLTHVICNVNCPEDVDYSAFEKVINEIAETLDRFPYFQMQVPIQQKSNQAGGLHDGAECGETNPGGGSEV